MELLLGSITLGTLATTFNSVGEALISNYRTRKDWNSKLQKAQEQEFQMILESDDLFHIGKYFDERIGKFNISENVENSEVSKTIVVRSIQWWRASEGFWRN